MCGFVGFADSSAVQDRLTTITNMMNTIIHRGPDSEGYYSDEHLTVGFRRLKMNELSEEGSQPMYNEERTLVLVFDGEIYNDQELRKELKAKGHLFSSESDCEVVLHGFEEYGEQILQRLRGTFAFAIWNTRERVLFMARDIFGIKPLYYSQHTTDRSFLFGSEIKSFLPHPAFDKQLNEDALRPYLTFQYSVLDETFFKGVYKLRPGHCLYYRNGIIQTKPYHEHVFESEEGSLDEYVRQIQQTMRESVKVHRISGIKVGSFLSGGIDSSYITALLKPDKTFSVGFQDYEGMFNETHHAKNLSNMLGIENHHIMVSAEQCFAKLPEIQYHMDEPQSNPSSLPLYFLAELASQHVPVVMSGEGADELFGGYAWYDQTPAMRKYKKIPYLLRRPISLMCKNLPQTRLTAFLVKGGQKVEERFIGQAKVFAEHDAEAVLKDRYKNGPSIRTITDPVYAKVKGKDDLTKMQYVDLMLWLPGDILLKADKMSMAHSLAVRVPFLDKAVLSLAARIPARYRVNRVNTKYALRQAALASLPDECANREKVGFPVPIRHWLREEKYYNRVKEMFTSTTANHFFETERLMYYLNEHFHGKHNYARYIWTVYVFLIWYNEFFIER